MFCKVVNFLIWYLTEKEALLWHGRDSKVVLIDENLRPFPEDPENNVKNYRLLMHRISKELTLVNGLNRLFSI